MKTSTQDRLLKDAILAADSWHKEASHSALFASQMRAKYLTLLERLPVVFLLGMLISALGILFMAQVF